MNKYRTASRNSTFFFYGTFVSGGVAWVRRGAAHRAIAIRSTAAAVGRSGAVDVLDRSVARFVCGAGCAHGSGGEGADARGRLVG